MVDVLRLAAVVYDSHSDNFRRWRRRPIVTL